MFRFALVSTLALTGVAAVLLAQQPAVQLEVGTRAPAFSLIGTDGEMHSLAEYQGKHVVLAWYPAALTPGCTAECKSFHENGDAIKAFDVAYFMASVDTPERNLEFAQVTEADFPLLSDPDRTAANAYGVLNARGTANRWTFYIGPDGTIRYIEKSVTATTAGEQVLETLARLNVPKP